MEASDPNSPSYEDAYRAAVQGEVEVLKNFYRRAPTSSINISGDTLFHVLALNGHTKAVTELLNLSMAINIGLRTTNFNGNTALHEAARVGALDIAKSMVQKEESLVYDSNLMGETPLYWAVAWGQTATSRFLAMKTSSNNPGLRRNDGSTILHAAVMGEFYGLALEIMGWYPDLALARDKDGNTALHLLVQSPSSFRSGTFYSDINLLYSSFIPLALLNLVIYFCIPSDAHKTTQTDLEDPCETENQQGFLQENRKQGMMRRLFGWSRTKVRLLGAEDMDSDDNYKFFVLQFLLQNKQIQRFPYLGSVDDEKQKHTLALELATLLIKRESIYIGHRREPIHTLNIGPSFTLNTINDNLMLAARHGIVEVVDVILEEYPWAVDSVDENEKNIFLLAAEFCNIGVFRLLKSKGFLTAKMVANIDNKGNTALHLAANFVDHRQKQIRISAYKMANETAWFKKVKGVSPAHLSQFRNKDGKTATEVFDDTHQHLIKDSVQWIKNTANVGMLVSTLIATMNFTAAFAVPGGYHQDTGLPVFTKTKDLPFFYAYSAIALFFCVCTLAAALSSYLSRFHMSDFYIFHPFKFLVAGISLIFSAIYSVTAFVQALILVTNGELTTVQWYLILTTTIIAIISFILVYVDIMFPVFRYFVYLLFE